MDNRWPQITLTFNKTNLRTLICNRMGRYRLTHKHLNKQMHYLTKTVLWGLEDWFVICLFLVSQVVGLA